ncbi:MAG TPA: hypothetical protein VF221_15265 [Chloroflexota bacterium]
MSDAAGTPVIVLNWNGWEDTFASPEARTVRIRVPCSTSYGASTRGNRPHYFRMTN